MESENVSDGHLSLEKAVTIELSTETGQIRVHRQTALGTYSMDIER
jgi:hypothetical protein